MLQTEVYTAFSDDVDDGTVAPPPGGAEQELKDRRRRWGSRLMPLRVCHYADLLCRYDADMGLKNVSLCRCYAVMPHMCHYADFDASIKRLPQEEVESCVMQVAQDMAKNMAKYLAIFGHVLAIDWP